MTKKNTPKGVKKRTTRKVRVQKKGGSTIIRLIRKCFGWDWRPADED